MASSSMLSTFMAHPSVRMKGTEDHWHPVSCCDSRCEFAAFAHMHCPMCTKESQYTDPVILKAHYRVKHVDKGVEFAGLKVLRCCKSCDIIGVISGYKNFKGPHWHCYRCRNGFNRRDEALKHFRTHFKNPQTTFQIQIVQDLNQSLSMDTQQGTSTANNLGMSTTSTTIALPSLGQTNRLVTVTSHQQETAMATNGISVAANETIDSNTDTIVLIETTDGNVAPSVHSLQTGTNAFSSLLQPGTTTASPDNHVYKANLILVQEKMKLEQKVEHLQRERMEMEHRYKTENQRLKAKVDQLTVSNSNLKQQVETLRKASAEHIPDSDQVEIEQLVKHMEEQHSQLVRHHLAQLRLYMNSQQITTANQELQDATQTMQDETHQRVQIIPVATAEALERMINQADNQQNSTLNLNQEVTMETPEGSYQVTLLPEVSSAEEAAHALNEGVEVEDTGESEMTTLSGVTVPYSDERTIDDSEVSIVAETQVVYEQEEQNGMSEQSLGKRSADQEDDVEQAVTVRKTRRR
ncbi:uncharacterized protein [Amphiura filiformis]|uniref:uncharacterized protein isoform X2 n=1 Tax=Amphiura filiformis TaxID=82378 RepID=UPI003B221F01